jgi:hypothetical protein
MSAQEVSFSASLRNTFQVSASIRNDRVDILVELAGHTAGNRLDVMAMKPAPVQVTCIFAFILRITTIITTRYRISQHNRTAVNRLQIY